jgi:hypothetical protein
MRFLSLKKYSEDRNMSSLLYWSQTFRFRKKPFTQGSLQVTGEKCPRVYPKRLLHSEG